MLVGTRSKRGRHKTNKSVVTPDLPRVFFTGKFMTDARIRAFIGRWYPIYHFNYRLGGPLIRRIATNSTIILFIAAILFTQSCSTLTKTMSATSTLGLGLGFAIGLGVQPRRQYAGAGAAAGAAIGLLTGIYLHQHIVEREDQVRQDTIFSIERIGIESESIQAPEVDHP